MKHTCIIRWLCGCLIFLSTACSDNKQRQAFELNKQKILSQKISYQKLKHTLDSVKMLIKPGDVITRTGNDFTSQSLKTLNRKDKTFSHCGIANIENDSVLVYHAIGGEWNPNQKIKRESFEAFINPAENNLMGIYRFAILKNIKENLIKTAKKFYGSNILFDMDFNLKTDDKMYCVEFVYKTFLIASSNKITFNHSFINNFEFVGVDDITQHKLSKQIAIVNYKLY
jgi:hypothetical protein